MYICIFFSAQVTSGMHTSDLDWMSLDAGATSSPQTAKPRPFSRGVSLRRNSEVNAANLGSMTPATERQGCPFGLGTGNTAGEREGGVEGYEGWGSRKRRKIDLTGAGQEADPAKGSMSGSSICAQGEKLEMAKGKARDKRKRGQAAEGRSKSRAGRGGGRGGGGAGRRRCPPSELAKRTQLLESLVVWTFEDVIVPLVSSVRLDVDDTPPPPRPRRLFFVVVTPPLTLLYY